LERLAGQVAAPGWSVVPGQGETDPSSGLGETSFALLTREGATIGIAGRLEDSAIDLPVWTSGAWGLEIVLPEEGRDPGDRRFVALSTHPSADRDLALLVPTSQAVGEVVALISQTGHPVLEDVEVLDVYSGGGMAEHLRSVTVRLRFQDKARTLTDQEVDGAVRRIVRAVEEEMGVELRGQQG
jgi:phenylalanyl-tRNA synthetase beta chain